MPTSHTGKASKSASKRSKSSKGKSPAKSPAAAFTAFSTLDDENNAATSDVAHKADSGTTSKGTSFGQGDSMLKGGKEIETECIILIICVSGCIT
jgi:hypothetical protein